MSIQFLYEQRHRSLRAACITAGLLMLGLLMSCGQQTADATGSEQRSIATTGPATVGSGALDDSATSVDTAQSSASAVDLGQQGADLLNDEHAGSAQRDHAGTAPTLSDRSSAGADPFNESTRGASMPQRRGILLQSQHAGMGDGVEELTTAQHNALLESVNAVLTEYGQRLTTLFAMQDVHSESFTRALHRWYESVDPHSALARELTERIITKIDVENSYLRPGLDGFSFRHVAYKVHSTPKFDPQGPDLWFFYWCGRTTGTTVNISTGIARDSSFIAMNGYGIAASENDHWWIQELEVAGHEQVDALPALNCTS